MAKGHITIKHGHMIGGKPSSTYHIWEMMKGRCAHVKNPAYMSYGGRGITVCERWQVFTNFLADMGVRPDGMTLDRLNNDLGYSPDNCAWRSRKHQARNRRDTMMVDYLGMRRSLADVCDERKVRRETVRRRLLRGVPLLEALEAKSQPGRYWIRGVTGDSSRP